MLLQFIICKVLQREAYLCAAQSPNTIDIVLVPQGLHNEPDKLRLAVQEALKAETDPRGRKYDASLLGYGLCSNGIAGLQAGIPIIVPRAHDCITLLLGSKEKYREYFDSHPGVYWYSSGWIEHSLQPGRERVELLLQTYREKYGEFLRMDFPRVPFASDGKLFQKLAALGARLTALHLLTSPELDPPTCRFEGDGDSRIGKSRKADGLRYDSGEQRVYVNGTQYFAPVAETVWRCQVGGYQVCEKWLKDRQERRLAVDDIRTYCRIVTALERTLALQAEADALYPAVEKNVLAGPG